MLQITQLRFYQNIIKIGQHDFDIVKTKRVNFSKHSVVSHGPVLLFLQRVSIACYAERCISHSKSVRPSVCPSVCHTLALSQNDTSYDHRVFTGG